MVGWRIERDIPAVGNLLVKVERKPYSKLSFRGKHNKVKLFAWLALLNVAGESGMPIRELARYAGTTQHSMRTLLCKWKAWGFVSCSQSRADTLYQLRSRGHDWLHIHFRHSPFDKWYELMDRQQREFYKHNLAQWQYLQGFTRGKR